MNFTRNVIKKLEREGFTVMPAKRHCGYELISINPIGRTAGVRVKAHGHISEPERKELLSCGMPVFVASEKYTGDSNTHDIKMVRLEK